MKNSLEQYEKYLQKNGHSSGTARSYGGDLRKFVRWYQEIEGRQPDIKSISPLDLAEFKRHLINIGQKPTTVNRAIMALSSFFRWAVGQKLLEQNPARGVRLVKENKTAPKFLDREKQSALMKAVQSSGKIRDIAIVTLLLNTGLIVSELCFLKIYDVNLNKRKSSIKVRSGNGRKQREIPLNSTAREALQNWLNICENRSGFVFYGKGSDSLTPRSVEYLLKKYSCNARLEKVTPHVLRHTFCKSLIDAGVPVDRVALLAGHESLNTTAKYTMVNGVDLLSAVEKLAWE